MEKTLFNRLCNTKVSGIGLPMYMIMVVLLFVALATKQLPKNMAGSLVLLVLLGHLFYFIGEKLPVVRSYLGGGSVVCIFACAALATFKVIPTATVENTKLFMNQHGFLDFYIAALITGAILGMNRTLLLKASVRFIPVAVASMVLAALAVGTVGHFVGTGFGHTIMYVAFPLMVGGMGAGVVPLSTIYHQALPGSDQSAILSNLIPATTLGNVMAIISAAVLVKIFKDSKIDGHGVLMPIDPELSKAREVKLDVMQIGTGMLLAMSFFVAGTLLNHVVPKVHAYAFIIILVVGCKLLNIMPRVYEDAAIVFNQVIMKNLTHAVLAGIGIALIDLNALKNALTWQFLATCVTSIVVISVTGAVIGKLFGLYPLESAITSGLCNNSMGGTGNVSVLSASNRMGLIAFAQMGNRLGGAIILILGGLLIRMWN